ncbi:phage virion morphogenesis protein [Pantoea sp. DY-5]|uniref:phage virion morphogenesis protein n=1 Tax=Pantoea sp. DY-5 TaxID=2871488 RepID=UPI001C979DB3|nr:phage virion morphogenesis protein [Pantoea sp. DY-5]MBY4837537.1 phage virion morphogenesis protein [Pantoea sp. DY-5]
MSDLQLVNDRLNALIGNLSPSSRKAMARNIAKKLRASQQQNIKRQQAPDGTPFKPRKAQPIRSKKGRVKREMFAKLRTAKYMKAQATSNEAVIEFTGRVQRMVWVHHYGLLDSPTLNSKKIRYPQRPLIGLNLEITKEIHKIIIEGLNK